MTRRYALERSGLIFVSPVKRSALVKDDRRHMSARPLALRPNFFAARLYPRSAAAQTVTSITAGRGIGFGRVMCHGDACSDRASSDTSSRGRRPGRPRSAAAIRPRARAESGSSRPANSPRVASPQGGRAGSRPPRAAPPRSRAARRGWRRGRPRSRRRARVRAASSRPVIPPQAAIFRQTARQTRSLERARAPRPSRPGRAARPGIAAATARVCSRPCTGSSHSSIPTGASERSAAIALLHRPGAVGVEADRHVRAEHRADRGQAPGVVADPRPSP